MTVASLGDVAFYVSDGTVQTIKSVTWKTSANYAVHNLHARQAALEFVGMNPQELELQCEASIFLGCDPMVLITNLHAMLNSQSVVPFILGTDIIGSRWVITDISDAIDRMFQDGTMLSAKITIKIKQYG